MALCVTVVMDILVTGATKVGVVYTNDQFGGIIATITLVNMEFICQSYSYHYSSTK